MPTIPLQGGDAPALRCPRDGQACVPRAEDGVTIDRCLACGGFWLDGKALSVLVGFVPPVPGGPMEEARGAGFACLKCGGSTYVTRMAGVETGACQRCRGAWVDPEELSESRRQMILERVDDEARFQRLAARLATEAPGLARPSVKAK